MCLARALMMVAIALLLVPPAGAHEPSALEQALAPGTYLDHLSPWTVPLGPGENGSQTLAFEGTPMPDGWLLVIHGVVENGTLEVALVDEGTLADWTWQPGVHTETVRLQHTGFPRLQIRNLGAGNATATLSYDQTCDCIGKATATERGPMFFNVDADQGERVRFGFTLVPVRSTIDTPTGHDFNGTLDVDVRLVDADETGRNLTVLQTWSGRFDAADGNDCTQAQRFNVCMDVSFIASHDGRQVLLMEAAHDMEGWVTQVRPVVEVGSGDREAPMVWFLPAVALTLAWCWRWR